MNREAKLQTMWKQLDGMDEAAILLELQKLQVTKSKEEILERLAQTYNDLDVADWIFATCQVDDSNSAYPKEFVDEAITKLARMHSFPFTHYGIISQDLMALHDPLLTAETVRKKRRECFQKFFQLCKRFQLTFFDHVVYTIHDDLDMGKELIGYLDELQKHDTIEDHREVVQIVERFFQTFSQMNPWLEEQLMYEQAESLIAMKSAKGEKLFQAMIKEASDPGEAITRYALSYEHRDANKQGTILKRYQKQINKDSEYYNAYMNLMKR